MGDILACRVCLSKDNKLFNMFKYNLAEPFEILTGIKVSEHDGLPNFICSYCSSLLVKSVSFREKCRNTQEFFKYSMLEQKVLSLDYLQSVRKQLNLSLSYNTLTNVITMEDSMDIDQIKVEEITDSDEKIKDEVIVELPNRVDINTIEIPLMNFEELTVKIEPKEIERDYDSFDFPPEADSDHEKNEELDDVEIIVLSKEQQKEEIEARKTSYNYLNSYHKCDQCYKGFIYDSTFKNHMMRHNTESGSFVCDICLMRWPEARQLRAHVAASHERKYLCKMCGHVSRSSHRAKEHRNWHTGFRFSCKVCGATFTKSTSYLTHLRLHHPSDHACEVCGESFIGEYGLRMHMRRAHKNAQQPDEVMEAMRCGCCSAQFLKLEALKRHQEEAKGGVCDPMTKPCAHCGEGLPTEEALKEHAACHQEDERVTCEDCSRTFASARSHAIHQQRVHLGVRQKQARPAHRPQLKGGAKHPSPESIVCEFCGKKTMTKAALRYHQRIHTGEKPYQCNQCPKRFSVCQRLQIHLRTHSGECPYKCSHCPKAFKHKAALNRHDRVHTGVKPYVCPHCDKAFSQSNSMKMHVNTVHLKMPSPYRSRKTKN